VGQRLRIAQVAPLYERVPPERYGGTERVVSYLGAGRADVARLDIRGLRVGEARVDLRLHGGRFGAGVEVTSREGDPDIVVRK